MSTASDIPTPGPLADQIAQLADYDVPVAVDLHKVVREGRRRVHRRQVRVGAAVALTGAAAVAAGTATWPLTETERTDDLSGVVGTPTAPSAGTDAWGWYDDPVAVVGGDEVDGRGPVTSRTTWADQQLLDAGISTSWLSGGSFTDNPSDSHSWAGPVLSRDRAGYVELALRRLLLDQLCDLRVAPPAATGRSCRSLDDDRGSAVVIEFTDSEQGPTRIVAVAHGGFTSAVVYSLGFPVTDRETYDPDAVHWSGRGPRENGDAAPSLTTMPTTMDRQVNLAWAQLGRVGP